MSDKREAINTVWFADDSSYTVGTNCEEIYLIADGNGLSGYYDRIHVLFKNGERRVIPAHNCSMWEPKP